MSVWIVKDGHGNPYLNARGEWSERQSEAVRFPSRERAWAGIEECLANKHTLEAPRILRLVPKHAEPEPDPLQNLRRAIDANGRAIDALLASIGLLRVLVEQRPTDARNPNE